MPNNVLTVDYMSDEVCVRLGGTGVEVELTAKDMDSCVNSTIALFNQYLPRRDHAALSVTQTQKRYEIAHPSLSDVVDFQFVDPNMADNVINPFFNNTAEYPIDLLEEGDTFGQYDQRLHYMESSSAIISAEPDYVANWERGADGNPVFCLYVSISRPYLCSYTYTWNITPDDDNTTGLRWVPQEWVGWVLDYATARAKLILSRIRGKFGGITGPDGGDQQIDWQELANEGREDEQRLREQIEKSRRPLELEIG